jgi:multidrug efflux system membrane fusion protein
MAAFLLVGCQKKSGLPPAPPAPTVTVSQPTRSEVMEWDEYPARLEALDMVEIRARVSGYLQSINFKDGAEVKKGDLLFVIDPRPYQAELDRADAELQRAQTRLELANNDLERADRLLKSKAISAEEADSRSKAKREAEAALVSARATVAAVKLNVDFTRITAPISGRIGRKMMTEGNLVNANQGQSSMLATIVSLDPIYCYFDADEQAALKYQKLIREGKVKKASDHGMQCELELANETDFPHRGIIDFLDNRVDTTTGTLRIRGVFPNPGPDHILQPGFFAKLRVPGSESYPALLIPEQAIGTDQGQKFVLTVNGQNVVERRNVKLGPELKGLRVVHEGIGSNDWVIVNGLMSARAGAPVNPTRGMVAAGETNSVAKKP